MLLLCLCLVLSLGTAAFGASMPDVTFEMSRPGYWSDLQADPSAVLLTAEEIEAQNAANMADPNASADQPLRYAIAVNRTTMRTFPSDAQILDVPADAYFADAVLWAAEQGITKGTDSTHFSPDQPCTRAEIVTFLQRAASDTTPAK